MLQVRKALPEDIETISRLFRKTIKTVNSKDYDPIQLNIWSARYIDVDWWRERVKKDCFLVAEKENRILGFCSVNPDGVLELMYVHKDYQGNRVGTVLMKEIEKYTSGLHIREIVSEVSITAKPFFEKMGFSEAQRNYRDLEGVRLTNFVMRKRVSTVSL